MIVYKYFVGVDKNYIFDWLIWYKICEGIVCGFIYLYEDF